MVVLAVPSELDPEPDVGDPGLEGAAAEAAVNASSGGASTPTPVLPTMAGMSAWRRRRLPVLLRGLLR